MSVTLHAGTLQNYLIFLPNKKYFKFSTNISKLFTWKLIVYAEENIENTTTSNSNSAPALINYCPLLDIKFNENCLINMK